MMSKQKNFLGYFYAMASAVIHGCMPIMAKYIYADGVSPLSLVFFQTFFALPSLALLAFRQQKTLKAPLRIVLPLGLLALFGCVLAPMLLFSSYNFLASGTATVFHFVYPSLVLLLGFIFLKKKIVIGTLVSVVLCFFGIALFYDPAESINLTGAALALASGLAFAIYVLLLPRFKSDNISGFLFSFYIALFSSVIMFVICLVTKQFTLPATLKGFGLCLLFAMSVTTGGVVLFQQGAFIIGGEKAAILGALEPITSVIIGILVFKESLKANTLIGSALVIAATIIIAVIDLRAQTAK